MLIEKKPKEGFIVEVCKKEGLSNEQCIKKIDKEINTVVGEIKDKTKNGHIINAPMSR